ncbi:MAG: transcriptional regulator [Actinomycetota bacterium]|nr:MAG: transcriptional regulator [Actinomycetota bacterium]
MYRLRQHDVYEAIADPTRRELIHLLAEKEESPLHLLTSHFPTGRTAVSKHLAVLKEAELVVDRKVGRETRYRLNPGPLKQVQDWLSHYENFWKQKAAALNRLIEEEK